MARARLGAAPISGRAAPRMGTDSKRSLNAHSRRAAMSLIERMREDVQAAFQHDPAARNSLEIVLAYPGLHAIWFHRIAHWCWSHDLKLIGRIASEVPRFIT